MAANDGDHYVAEMFPGIQNPAGTGAHGSVPGGSRKGAPVPGGLGGLPDIGSTAPLSFQAGEHHSTSTEEPGQFGGVELTGGVTESDGVTDTGAGHGRTAYSWQRGDGSNGGRR